MSATSPAHKLWSWTLEVAALPWSTRIEISGSSVIAATLLIRGPKRRIERSRDGEQERAVTEIGV